MILRDLLNDHAEVKREVLIGREIEVQDKKALLLGLREIDEVEDGELEVVSRMMVLHEDNMEDYDDWDEDEEWEEDEDQTNRQLLIESMEMDGDVSVTDIDAFHINGKRYETEGVTESYLEEQPYEEIMLIKHYAEKGCVPQEWMEKDVDMLALAAYDVDPAMFDVSWNADILGITVEMMEPIEEVLVGKVLRCGCGRYAEPKTFSIKGKNGEDVEIRLHGVYLHNIWTDASCLEMDFSDLEEYCDRDERLLVVEYSTDADLQLEFYTKDYLDAPADEGDEVFSFGLISSAEEGHELCVVDVVPEDFDDEVEIELLSYTI